MAIRKIKVRSKYFVQVSGCDTLALCLPADEWEGKIVNGFPFLFGTVDSSKTTKLRGSSGVLVHSNPQNRDRAQYSFSFDDAQFVDGEVTEEDIAKLCSYRLVEACSLQGLIDVIGNRHDVTGSTLPPFALDYDVDGNPGPTTPPEGDPLLEAGHVHIENYQNGRLTCRWDVTEDGGSDDDFTTGEWVCVFDEISHGVTQSSQITVSYDVDANPGPVAPPTSPGDPVEGHVHIEYYNNGTLTSWYDDGAWVSVFTPTPHRVLESDQTGNAYDTTTNPDPVDTPPTPLIVGDFVKETYANGCLLAWWDGTQWVKKFVPTAHQVSDITVSSDYVAGSAPATPPTDPQVGHIHIERYNNGVLEAWWDGTQWVTVFIAAPHGVTSETVASLYVSGNAPGLPTNPQVGHVHVAVYNNGTLNSWWDGTQWVTEFIAAGHQVSEAVVIGNYVGGDPINQPTNPVVGHVVVETYDDGVLLSWWDGTQWVNYFDATPIGAISSLTAGATASSGAATLTHFDGDSISLNFPAGPRTLAFNDTCVGSSGNGFLMTGLTLNGYNWEMDRVADHTSLADTVRFPSVGFGAFGGPIATLNNVTSPAFAQTTFTNPSACRSMEVEIKVTNSFAADAPSIGGLAGSYVLGHNLYINGSPIANRDGRQIAGFNQTVANVYDPVTFTLGLEKGLQDYDLTTIIYTMTLAPGASVTVGTDFGFSTVFFPIAGLNPTAVSLESRQISIVGSTL